MSTKKNKSHLTLSKRIKIQACIEKGFSARKTSNICNINVSTIYREIQRNLFYRNNNKGRALCYKRTNCVERNKNLNNCNSQCPNYVKEVCPNKLKFPFVCNTCNKKHTCNHTRQFYFAEKAHEFSNKRLIETRIGIRISESDFNQIDNIVSPLVLKKQSLNHILTTHTEIDVSERTLRNWINKGYMQARNIDLPRKVTFKTNRNYVSRVSKPASILDGRMYRDYKKYSKEHPEKLVSQFDTVHGLITDNKTILTIHFPSLSFQFGILLSSCDMDEVNAKLSQLKNNIGVSEWKRIFAIILTDNGPEFNSLHLLETDETNEELSKVFFCDPYKSGQKGSCERNHELFRYIQPKKQSIEYLTQDILNEYFSHINCLYRKGLNGVRPYDLAKTVLGNNFLSAIGIYEVSPDDVTFRKKDLLKK
jgi:IS30 family transposase